MSARPPLRVVGRKTVYRGRVISVVREVLDVDGRQASWWSCVKAYDAPSCAA